MGIQAGTVTRAFVTNGIVHKWHVVKHDGTGIVEATANTQLGVAVIDEDAASGDQIAVATLGPAKVWCDASGAAIAVGDPIAADASGHGVKDATAGHQVLGYAMEALASGLAAIVVDVCRGSV